MALAANAARVLRGVGAHAPQRPAPRRAAPWAPRSSRIPGLGRLLPLPARALPASRPRSPVVVLPALPSVVGSRLAGATFGPLSRLGAARSIAVEALRPSDRCAARAS